MKYSKAVSAVICSVALMGVVGCKKKEKPSAQAAPTATATQQAPTPAKTAAAKPDQLEVSWTDPEGWQPSTPKSAMRKAQYTIPAAAGDKESAELAVFYFGPGQGGSIDDNMTRWIRQFSDVDKKDVQRAERTVNDLNVHTVGIESGTYASGMPGAPSTPKKEFALLGAIVEAPSGLYFFKMTGPSKTVASAKAGFQKLLDSLKATGK